MKTEKVNFTESMKELAEINLWFTRADIDLDEAMEKLKRGNFLIKECRKKLVQVENEFEEIQKETEESADAPIETIVIAAESDTTDIPFRPSTHMT